MVSFQTITEITDQHACIVLMDVILRASENADRLTEISFSLNIMK
jgi:hypothetical protein